MLPDWPWVCAHTDVCCWPDFPSRAELNVADVEGGEGGVFADWLMIHRVLTLSSSQPQNGETLWVCKHPGVAASSIMTRSVKPPSCYFLLAEP